MDVHRLSLVDFLPIRRRPQLINEPFEREPVGVDDLGRVGSDEERTGALEYGRVT